jgi:hypothetical protein
MCLRYEHSSEALNVFVKWMFLKCSRIGATPSLLSTRLCENNTFHSTLCEQRFTQFRAHSALPNLVLITQQLFVLHVRARNLLSPPPHSLGPQVFVRVDAAPLSLSTSGLPTPLCAAREALKVLTPLSPAAPTNPTAPCPPFTPECKRGSRSREQGTGAYFNFSKPLS